LSERVVAVLLVFFCAEACGDGLGPPETSLHFSFEQDMGGWTPAAADTGAPGGAYAPWSIERTADIAFEGAHALTFDVVNNTDAAKIWIVRPFAVTPGRSYQVDISFAFATRDWGDANLFTLLAGSFLAPPSDGPTLLAGTRHESTGNGANHDVGYQWLRRTFRVSARPDGNGMLFVVVGIWGTWETPRTYYVDDLSVQFTPN
jgi:hypothetical protein